MNKKGSSMVEAALIFPIVILAVMGVIYILIFFYDQVAVRSNMHIALRQEAGATNGTTEYVRKIEGDFPVYQKGKMVYFEGDMVFRGRGLLRRRDSSLHGSVYMIRGKEIVRYADLL